MTDWSKVSAYLKEVFSPVALAALSDAPRAVVDRLDAKAQLRVRMEVHGESRDQAVAYLLERGYPQEAFAP